MKVSLVFCALLTCLSGAPGPPLHGQTSWVKDFFLQDVNGGAACAACSVLFGLAEQLAEIHNSSIARAFEIFCEFLPDNLQKPCKGVIVEIVPEIIELLEAGETPDMVCYATGLCKNDTGEFCHLFPLPKHESKEDLFSRAFQVQKKFASLFATRGYPEGKKYLFRSSVFIKFCDIDIFKPICDIFNDHIPFSLTDTDGDYFSTIGSLRGYYWRGKDCNDKDRDIYPGRHTINDSTVDTNCNGIVGVDPTSGETYESLWCSKSQQMGTILLGDSAGAHFHIPPAWLTSKEMSKEAFKDILLVLENEFDWPMMSSTTGFMNSSWSNLTITGKVDSLYLRLHELNRCNHRDYQNIAVNGARSSAMAEEIVKSFARRGVEDNPVFLTLALIGNDVCDGHPNMQHMTKPEDFRTHTLETLNYVDQHVAPGSIVITMGLVDGRALYEILAHRTHPIGSLHDDVNYSQMYDYLNCLQISPCFGWMNSNETWRNLTTERAMQLNAVLKDVVANTTFKNFKVFYIDPPLPAAIGMWVNMGHEAWELVEPVDGFHPSQTGQAFTAELVFKILAGIEGALPKRNPFNNKIVEKFGDQGGYL